MLDGDIDMGLSHHDIDKLKSGQVEKDGRIITSGRRLMLEIVDALFADTHNSQKVAEKLQERLDMDPLGTYLEIVVPLTPKSMLEEVGADDGEDAGAFAEHVRSAVEEMESQMVQEACEFEGLGEDGKGKGAGKKSTSKKKKSGGKN